MKKHNNKILILMLLVSTMALNYNANAQTAKDGMFYTLAVDPTLGGKFSSLTIPPVSLYIERGVANFLSLGLAVGTDLRQPLYSDETLVSLGMTVRAVGYAFQALEEFSDEELSVAGLEPYLGFTFGQYWPSIGSSYATFLNHNKLGIVLGTRWYPGDKKNFGIMVEYTSAGNTGWGSGINLGVTFGR
ncbi:hypothetical protein [Cyclobacterium amurskyense]|jgi:hypothetical protein|uniref:Outer membrane protein beta-barrel domain-containing protein n=1 Tax=Cyclobacterium amurskyense TaxID=320787 RepID=A0A0H4P5U1_9BACT|nr:hypothetical protein [Cyclobacterium amurskyense]AKP49806.1 hypothetical protein CA2015_0327 [Cyclobacterium amurskyense]